MTQLTYTAKEVKHLMDLEAKFTREDLNENLQLLRALAIQQGKEETLTRILPLIEAFAYDALRHRTKMADVKQLFQDLQA